MSEDATKEKSAGEKDKEDKTSKNKQLRQLLKQMVGLMCRQSLTYENQFHVEGLLGITVDENEVFLVSVNEIVRKDGTVVDNTAPRPEKKKKEEEDDVVVIDSTPAPQRKRGDNTHRRQRDHQQMSPMHQQGRSPSRFPSPQQRMMMQRGRSQYMRGMSPQQQRMLSPQQRLAAQQMLKQRSPMGQMQIARPRSMGPRGDISAMMNAYNIRGQGPRRQLERQMDNDVIVVSSQTRRPRMTQGGMIPPPNMMLNQQANIQQIRPQQGFVNTNNMMSGAGPVVMSVRSLDPQEIPNQSNPINVEPVNVQPIEPTVQNIVPLENSEPQMIENSPERPSVTEPTASQIGESSNNTAPSAESSYNTALSTVSNNNPALSTESSNNASLCMESSNNTALSAESSINTAAISESSQPVSTTNAPNNTDLSVSTDASSLNSLHTATVPSPVVSESTSFTRNTMDTPTFDDILPDMVSDLPNNQPVAPNQNPSDNDVKELLQQALVKAQESETSPEVAEVLKKATEGVESDDCKKNVKLERAYCECPSSEHSNCSHVKPPVQPTVIGTLKRSPSEQTASNSDQSADSDNKASSEDTLAVIGQLLGKHSRSSSPDDPVCDTDDDQTWEPPSKKKTAVDDSGLPTIKKRPGRPRKNFQCSQCTRKFINQEALDEHFKLLHA